MRFLFRERSFCIFFLKWPFLRTKSMIGLFQELFLKMAAGLGANANGADLVQVGASPFLRRTRVGANANGADVFGCSSGQISWRRPAQRRCHLR